MCAKHSHFLTEFPPHWWMAWQERTSTIEWTDWDREHYCCCWCSEKNPFTTEQKRERQFTFWFWEKKPSLIYGHLAKMTSFQFLPKDSKEPSMDDIYVGPMLLPRHSKWQLTWQQFRKQWFTHISLYLQMYSSKLCRFATLGNNGSKSGISNFQYYCLNPK